MKRKIFLLICVVLIAALLIGVLAACDPGSKEQGGSQTPGDTTTPGEPGITTPVNPGQGDEEQNPGQGDEGQEPGQDDEEQNPGQGDEGQEPGQDDEEQNPGQGGEVIEPAKLIFEKTDAGYSVTGYEGTPTAVVIPDTHEGLPVTSIGMYAFYNCDSLTSVAIGNGVTSIGGMAFVGCTSLERLTVAPGNPVYHSAGNCIIETETGTLIQGCNNSVIPTDGSVTSIGGMAFVGCTSLTSVTIPDSVTSIGYAAFYNCNSLTSIVIPDSVTSIGYAAFYNCTSLTFVALGNGVTSIGSSAFYWCYALEAVHITDIGKWAAIEFGDSDANPLNNGAALYLDDKLVAELVIPDGVISIGNYAFYGYDRLTSITIPDSVTSIGSYAFEGCDNLQYNEYGNALYLGSNTNPYLVLIAAKNESITSVDINASTKVIYGSAFYLCSSLTSVTIPESVTSIGSSAFSGCVFLETLTVDKRNPVYHSVGNCVIETATGALVQGCNNSVIPTDGSVTSIGDSAFAWCTSLTSITIPDSVTSIDDSAFAWCISLTSVTIPDSVTSIGSDAFA